MLLSLSACGEKKDDVVKIGVLEANEIGMANMSTEEHWAHMNADHNFSPDVELVFEHYNNLSTALMDLESGKIKNIIVEESTANYIAARNEKVAITADKCVAYFSMMTMENNKDIYKKTTAMHLYLRIMIGGFLIYLAYSLGIDLKNVAGSELMILGSATVLFSVAGVVIAGWSLYRLVKKDYYDPMTDGPEEEEPEGEDSEQKDPD
jgi:hypothetical protein